MLGLGEAVRMGTRVLLGVMILSYGVSSSSSQDDTPTLFFNYSSLVTQYITVCGVSNLCDKSFVSSFNLTERDFQHKLLCPKCSCDVNCFQNSNMQCCPDVYFMYGVPNCRSVGIINTLNENMNHHILLDDCPNGSDKKLKEECTKVRTPYERLGLPPVSSEYSKFTFWNRYCAECHNASNFQPWNLFFECEKKTDFNYLSSYGEIIDKANRSSCSIAFEGEGERCSPVNPDQFITTCNVTGKWDTYDLTLDSACKSAYNLTFKQVFKNVFCYLCNTPTKQIEPARETCPHPSSSLANLCRGFPRTTSTLPYRNAFCLLCHDSQYEFEANIQLSKTIAEVDIHYSVRVFPETFQIMLHLISRVQPLVAIGEKFTDKYIAQPEKELNITNLAIKSFAFTGHGLCSSNMLPENLRNLGTNCSCDVGCFKNCCIDHALENPFTSCINADYPPKHTTRGGFRVINRCRGADSEHCVSPLFEDLFHTLPVNGKRSGKSYRNIFCHQCNQDPNYPPEETMLWGLNISCNQFINPDYFPSLGDLMNVMKKANCTIRLLPDKSAQTCGDVEESISECNRTGLWSTDDTDIKQACETLPHNRLPYIGPTWNSDVIYKNVFCQMCNPVVKRATRIVEDCKNKSAEISAGMVVEACEKISFVEMSSPYKNIFCERCHGYKSQNAEKQIEEQGPFVIIDPQKDFRREKTVTYRTLFSLSSYESGEQDVQQGTTCEADQHLDKHKNLCRDMICFPGKILFNGTCVSLLPQTKNMRYIIYFRMNSIGNIEESLRIEAVVDALYKTINMMLRKVTNLSENSIHIEDHIFLANKDCNAKELSGLQLYAQMVVFITDLINRSDVERKLVSFSNSLHQLSIKNTVYNFSFSQNENPTIFPFFATHCLYKKTKTMTASLEYRKVYVNKLLFCPQVLINPEDYSFSASTGRLSIGHWNVSLPQDKFMLAQNKSARICILDINYTLQANAEQSVDKWMFSLSLLTFICIVISLVCLILTFIVYCVFQSLRTLPGLNNMCLIISLFFAQLMTLIRPYIVDIHTLSMASSIAVHYFWLSVFFWLQVCSFHMFRVFTRKTHPIKNEKDTCLALTRYAVYAHGIPTVVVAAHLIVNLVISNGDNTGYENVNGIVNTKLAFIVTIISPMLLICVTNSIFFIVTAIRIRNTPHAQKNQKQSVEVWIYVKLFTLTGLTWIFQVVDSFLSLSFLSYVVAILNGLQGLFLFLSYVCNGRVLRLCCKQNTRHPSTLNSTTNHSSPISATKSTKSTKF